MLELGLNFAMWRRKLESKRTSESISPMPLALLTNSLGFSLTERMRVRIPCFVMRSR